MDIKQVAVIGCGSMGGGMALLIAEHGIQVSLQDQSNENMDRLMQMAKREGFPDLVSKHESYESLCKSLGEPKIFFFSLPHGTVGDTVLDGLMPHLVKDDVIMDCGNEHWQNTERRQGKCVTKGVRYVGCGVSGGYQAARRGPSICPSSDNETLDLVLPMLRKVAATDTRGEPCVGKVGTGGAGHYCKMIHNGIEHAMMSGISEAWAIMVKGLDMSLDDVADEFQRWNESDELRGTFLVKISADICRTEDPKTGERVLETVKDKVVQDFTGEEGTGVWSNIEAVEQHVPAPTLSTAHFLRIASGDSRQRSRIQETFGRHISPPRRLAVSDKFAFLECLRLAVYINCLAAYAQGMNTIDKANKAYQFNISYSELIQVWRAGCIIQADFISEKLLQPIYANSSGSVQPNLLYEPIIAEEIQRGFAALKTVVLKAGEADHVVPSLSATLEYLKIQMSTDLPTSLYEAQLDYFGAHKYDRKDEDKNGRPTEGKYHFEWQPA